jgi:hypothetical protein
MPIDPSEFCSELTTTFPTLNRIERAKALNRGAALGLSNRKMAKLAGCCESTVRQLRSLLSLPLKDQTEVIATGQYRRALRRVQELAKAKAEVEAAEELRRGEEAAARGSKLIRKFFWDLRLASAFAEQTTEEAKVRIWEAEGLGVLKPSTVKWAANYRQIIAESTPKQLAELEQTDYLNVIIIWFCRWAVLVMPDSRVRDQAFETALERHYVLGI